MDKSIIINCNNIDGNIKHKYSSLDYNEWGWYIDIDNTENHVGYMSVPPSPSKIKSHELNDCCKEIDDTRSELNRTTKQLFTEDIILFEYPPSTEIFVTIGSTTIITSIMAYVIFFIL